MAEEFKVLSDVEHVLARPNVYVGSVVCEEISGIIGYTYQTKSIVPALIKIIEECLQNSIDENIRTDGKFATNISVNIDSGLDGTEISISDDGRGIPQDVVDGVSRPLLAWTCLRAGSNFSNDGERITAGLNGMGVSLTNIFSKSFVGETCDGKRKIIVSCSDNMSKIGHRSIPSNKRGTTVTFVPDLARFGLSEFTQDHVDIIKDRISNFAIAYPDIQFKFNGEKIHLKNIKSVAKQFHEDAISLETNNSVLVFAPSGDDEEFRCLSYVNGIYIKNGGSHIDYIMGQIIDNVRTHVRKKHKIDVLPNQIKQHLLIATWFRKFTNCRFDSQSKERITNTQGEVAEYLKKIDFDKLSKQILNTPSIIDPMIAAILYKKEMAEKLALAKQTKATKKIRIVNHIAATSKIIDEKKLCIAEGLSAIGMLIECRDSSSYIGGYPLKGKIMNVRGMKHSEIMKNKEIAELLSIIGLELGNQNLSLNYGKIYLMTDSDQDGSHIRGLLLNLFSLWPALFEQGRICQIETPLYICTKGKDIKWFYTKSDLDKANLKGYTCEYMKGLGSLPKEVYRECINNPKLVVFDNSDNFESLELGFGDSADERKKWMMA